MSISLDVFEETLRGFFAPIGTLLADETVSEIFINRYDEVYVDRDGALERADARFDSEMDLVAALTNLAQSVGKTLGPRTPVLEASLPDGARLEAVLPPAAVQGPCAAIRCARDRDFALESFFAEQPRAREALAYVGGVIANKCGVLVCGSSRSGKTTLVRALLSTASPTHRLITIERCVELVPKALHVVQLSANDSDTPATGGASVGELLRAALRMRPDCLALGDLRAGEAFELIRSMESTTSGFVATVCASRPVDALSAVEAMSLEARPTLSMEVLGRSIASAIDVIVQTVRCSDGCRQVARIVEVEGWTSDSGYTLCDRFEGEELR